VGEARDRLRLAFEPHAECGVVSKRRRENLEGDDAIKAGVAGAVDLSHAADSEQGLNFKMAESTTCAQCHRSVKL
jgi:hypothetical protein